MRFAAPLRQGRLIKRYKRFLADIVLDSGEAITAHIANPGAMTGLAEEGMRVWLSRSDNPSRKLPDSWELVLADGGLVGVNTMHPNQIVAEALSRNRIPELAGYGEIRREVVYGRGSRVDFRLRQPGRPDCYVEVKNVHLKQGAAACFPDSVTARGAKHLRDLADCVKTGARAVMLFLVQREDCAFFRVADWIDPAYGRLLRSGMAEGVETLCYACTVTVESIDIGKALPIKLDEVP